MTKILCIGDIHAMDHPPQSINEGYMDEIYDILKFCTTLDYDIAVSAGDVFDKKAPSKNSHGLVRGMLESFQALKSPAIVPGNHDIVQDRQDSIPTQPLGVLYQAGIFHLEGWHPDIPDLYGVPWQDWDDPKSWRRAFADYRKKATETSLIITHCPLFPPSIEEGVIYEHVPTKDIAKAMGGKGSVFYGHIHEFHGIFESGGVQFCNLGSVSRGALHEYNVTRTPQVAIFDTETATFEPVEVPHRPAEEHFRIAEKTAERATSKELEQFIEDIGSESLDMSHTESVVEYIQTNKKVPKKVRDVAVELLREVQ